MPNWIAFIVDRIVLAFLVGLSTTGMFLVILSRFKPKVDMSPKTRKSQGLNI